MSLTGSAPLQVRQARANAKVMIRAKIRVIVLQTATGTAFEPSILSRKCRGRQHRLDRNAGGPAGMATLGRRQPRSSASPPFGGFALSSENSLVTRIPRKGRARLALQRGNPLCVIWLQRPCPLCGASHHMVAGRSLLGNSAASRFGRQPPGRRRSCNPLRGNLLENRYRTAARRLHSPRSFGGYGAAATTLSHGHHAPRLRPTRLSLETMSANPQ